MNKKIFLILLPVALLGMIIGGLLSIYTYSKLKKQPPSEKISQSRLAPKETVGLNIPEEMSRQLKEKTTQKQKECIEKIKTMSLRELAEEYPEVAERLIICHALKEKNKNLCTLLKAKKENYEKCKNIVGFFSEVVDPLFRTKQCNEDIFQKAERFGVFDAKAMCRAMFLREKNACEQITPSFEKVKCIALAENDVNLCEKYLSNKDVIDCKDTFYLLKALNENNSKYLSFLREGINVALGKVFFNESGSCEEWLFPFNEKYCVNFYSEEYILKQLEKEKPRK